MTEAEWLSSTRPRAMLGYLIDGAMRARYADGTYRLLACAAARRIDPAALDRRSLRAVEVAERFARREATSSQLAQARRNAHEAAASAPHAAALEDRAGALCAVAVAGESGASGAWEVAQLSQHLRGLGHGDRLPDLLREIFGNPFHTPMLPEHWRDFDGGTILRLARHAREDGAFDEMPVLGDALEEAGCTDVQILEHCRSERPHAAGCWVLELLLAEG
jgi:hypothetical protein